MCPRRCLSTRIRLAFTPIERRVVIAIIAIRAGMLLTSLAGAKEAAPFMACWNNLRRIGLAHQLYAGDQQRARCHAIEEGKAHSVLGRATSGRREGTTFRRLPAVGAGFGGMSPPGDGSREGGRRWLRHFSPPGGDAPASPP